MFPRSYHNLFPDESFVISPINIQKIRKGDRNATRDYHTKWRKSERERQIPYDITYVEPRIWQKQTYPQNKNRLTDTENRPVIVKRWGGGEGIEWEFRVSRYQLLGFPGGSEAKSPPANAVETNSILEEEMSPHSSILAWESSWTEEPGRLQSMVSQRIRHDLLTKQQ